MNMTWKGKVKFVSQILQWGAILQPHVAGKSRGKMLLNCNAFHFTQADNRAKRKPGENYAFEKWQYICCYIQRVDFVLADSICTVFCSLVDFENAGSPMELLQFQEKTPVK